MSKLTKSQQAIVDRMAAGEILCDSHASKSAWMDGGDESTVVPKSTARQLEKLGMISWTRTFYHIETYTLTPTGRAAANTEEV